MTDLLECDQHGESEAAYICQHLMTGERLGFHYGYGEDDLDTLYPDAWCSACEKVYQEEGGWTDAAMQYADIKLLCSRCYETAREKNWVQKQSDYIKLVNSSQKYLQKQQKKLLKKYKIDEHEQWDWDQDTGKLIFSHDGVPQVEADIHFSGSFSRHTNTWMWSWANTSHDESIKKASRKVRQLGEQMALHKLASAHWEGSQEDCWDMTAILAKTIRAIGAYRSVDDDAQVYMVISKARWLV